MGWSQLHRRFLLKIFTMKRIFVLSIISLSLLEITAQTPQSNINASNDIVSESNNLPYKLFSTNNMWTFLKLDTRNGRLWQVQWNINEDKRFETFLNILPLVSPEDEKEGRFELYPTTNIYNFVMLDRISGNTWQVQWSQDPKKRFVVPIW